MFPTYASSQAAGAFGTMHAPVLQEKGMVVHLAQLRLALCECAAHVAAGRFDQANRCFERIASLSSVVDGPLQRLAKIMADGLSHRLLCFTPGISKALVDPSSYFDKRSIRKARCKFFELTPLLKAAFVTINRAIREAMDNEKFVHIIDLSGQAAHPWQWLKLMDDFRSRRRDPPHLRITVVHDDEAFLGKMSALLSKKAGALDMAFSFHRVLGRLETLDFSNLHEALAIKSGDARAVSCALQMHRLLAVNDTVSNAGVAQLQQVANMAQIQQLATSCSGASSIVHYLMEMIKMNLHPSPTTPLSPFLRTPSPQNLVPQLLVRFLSAVRALSPNIMVVVEQDASHNGLDFMERFEEVLHYYAALFDALDTAATAYQKADERVQVEQILLGEEIRDLLVREGVERHERHERLHQWAMRMETAGFGNVPLSYIAAMEGNEVLRNCGLRGYENREQGGCFLLCRSSRPLYSVSAWRPYRGCSTSGSTQHMDTVVPGQIAWPAQQAPAHNFTS